MSNDKKEGVNKMDAVRQIISKHGKDTMPVEIVRFMKTEFGADITPGTASTYKGSILKKQAEATAASPPEKKPATPKPAATPAPANGKAAKGKKVNKMAAVRQVISKHGKDTMPVEIVKLVKAEHGVDMSTDMASTYKSAALKTLGLGGVRKGKRGRKPGPKPAVTTGTNGTTTPSRSVGGVGISLEDIQAVKTLVDRMGAEKVGQLAGVLAK